MEAFQTQRCIIPAFKGTFASRGPGFSTASTPGNLQGFSRRLWCSARLWLRDRAAAALCLKTLIYKRRLWIVAIRTP